MMGEVEEKKSGKKWFKELKWWKKILVIYGALCILGVIISLFQGESPFSTGEIRINKAIATVQNLVGGSLAGGEWDSTYYIGGTLVAWEGEEKLSWREEPLGLLHIWWVDKDNHVFYVTLGANNLTPGLSLIPSDDGAQFMREIMARHALGLE